MKFGVSPRQWLLALLLCMGAACASAAQETNGHGELSSDVFSTKTVPSPRPLPVGEGGKVSLRDARIRNFVRGSQQEIISARAGKPFIIAFWSLTCANCREDMALLGKLAKKYRYLDLILVSTDSPEQKQEIVSTLQHYLLGRTESWVFADSFTERLRFEVDPQWYGELPRTYFFEAGGRSTAISGTIDRGQVERWIRESKKRG